METLIGHSAPNTAAYCRGPNVMIGAFEAAMASWPAGTARAEYRAPLPLPPYPEARPCTLVLSRSRWR